MSFWSISKRTILIQKLSDQRLRSSSRHMKNALQLTTPLSINSKSTNIFNSLIESCSSLIKDLTFRGSFAESRALHALLLKRGLTSDRFISVKLLIMYLKRSPSSTEIDQLLKDFNAFDLVVSNCLISASVEWGNLERARHLFDQMPERNSISWTALISGFLKHGRFEESMWFFDRNPFHNVVSWTAAITGFAQHGLNLDALWLFKRMIRSGFMPNAVTFTSVVKSCADLRDSELGMSLFGFLIKAGFEENVSVCNSLITSSLRVGELDMAKRIFDSMRTRDVISWTAILDMYVEMGDLQEARRIFEEMPERNSVSWSAMIARYSQSGSPEEALELFRRMLCEGFKPNVSCLSSVTSALATLKVLHSGMTIQGYVIKIGVDHDVFISSSVIDLYCKCGRMSDARLVFDSSPNRNVVSWNSLVAGYNLNGLLKEAGDLFEEMPDRNTVSWNGLIAGYMENEMFSEVFEIFDRMLLSGQMPNSTTFSTLFSACASTSSLEKGRSLHGRVIKLATVDDVIVGTALLDMYAKSGDIESSRVIFRGMSKKNEISWTVMIQALAESGLAEESVNLFVDMQEESYVTPNELTLLAVLFACSHGGLIDRGLKYFNSMENVYGIKPKTRHYNCVVDMLSRSGKLSEAEKLIRCMPFPPDSDTWASLLSGCKMYRRKDIAERVVREVLEVTKKTSAGYVLLSNIYASFGRWMDVSDIRRLMKEKELKKIRGCSWVGIKNRIHTFHSEDGSCLHHSAEVYEMLQLLRSELRAF